MGAFGLSSLLCPLLGDIAERERHVRKVPMGDIERASLNLKEIAN
jgi:hypothetical protein